MATPLTLYGVQAASTTLPTAAAVTTASGASSFSGVPTAIGTGLYWGEIAGLPNLSNVWPNAYTVLDASGMGFLWDSNTLDNCDMLGGTWTITSQFETDPSGTITADAMATIGIWKPGSDAIIPVGQLLVTGNSITSSGATVVTYSGPVDQFRMNTGDRLYFGFWLNITQNGLGNSSEHVKIILPTGGTQGSLGVCSWVTPGYQPSTETELLQAPAYGSFLLSDLRGYYILERPMSFPSWAQTTQKIGRRMGVKKSGEVINERPLPVKLKIVGKSRPDLIQKIDALYQALMIRQQKLALSSYDGRYWIADCVDCKITLINPITAEATLQFVSQMPFALSIYSGSFVDSSVAYTLLSGSTYQRGPLTLATNGNVWSDPTITITNNTPLATGTLTTGLTNGNNVTSLVVSAIGKSLMQGDFINLASGGNSQSFEVSATVSAGATTVPVFSTTANFSYPGGTTTYSLDTALQSVTINDSTDGRSITVSLAPNNIIVGIGHSVTFVCDEGAINGGTVYVNPGTPLAFSGIFPSLQPYPTVYTVQVQAGSQPTCQASFSWTPRWAA